MLRATLALIGWMWTANVLASSDECPRRQSSPELESRIAVAADTAKFQRQPDFLTMKLCGSGKYAWASFDTRHELQQDGSELWSQLWCMGGFRRGDWSCQRNDARGVRVAVPGFKFPVQVAIPLDWPVARARERIVSGFEAFGSLTSDQACDGGGPFAAEQLDDLRKEWKIDDFATFMLDGKVDSYSLSRSLFYLHFGKSGFECWGVEDVVVTSDTRHRAERTHAIILASTGMRKPG
jgi:hypothetical protein